MPPTEPTITPAAPSGPPESRATSTEVTTEAPCVDEKEVSEDGKNDVSKSEKNEGNNQQSEETDEKDPGSVKSEIENIEQSESKEGPVSEAVVDKERDVKTKDEDKKIDETATAENKDKSSENADSTAEGASLSSFQQLSSSQNAFTGLAGTGFSTSLFSFGYTPKDVSTSSVPLFGRPFVVSKKEGSGLQAMPEVPVKTGEEKEKVVFSADSVLFELIGGAWKEREMKLTNMDKRGITFACMNSSGEEKEGLPTFSLKFKDASIVEEFRAAHSTLFPPFPISILELSTVKIVSQCFEENKLYNGEVLLGGSEEKKMIHWVRWSIVCQPKVLRGLGIIDLNLLNRALLGKWSWKFATEKGVEKWKKIAAYGLGTRRGPTRLSGVGSLVQLVWNVSTALPHNLGDLLFDCLVGDPSLADLQLSMKKVSSSSGFFKVNIDGAMDKDWQSGGIGGLLHNSNRELLGSFSKHVGLGPPILTELMAIKTSLRLFIESGEGLKEDWLWSVTFNTLEWIKNPGT
ncbi:Coatomer, beta' subunit isoform 1 [Hibiscus syriacus]|uniref:Coatomer, beta' subunit isoform 1 n=1 Tax=Hibiscus syriacus TaxID=106335 RepID=A0A6A2YDV0_HIBSY|nr:Coatomer, beta' subunit isoform 1 [Hibiscus syriacus]